MTVTARCRCAGQHAARSLDIDFARRVVHLRATTVQQGVGLPQGDLRQIDPHWFRPAAGPVCERTSGPGPRCKEFTSSKATAPCTSTRCPPPRGGRRSSSCSIGPTEAPSPPAARRRHRSQIAAGQATPDRPPPIETSIPRIAVHSAASNRTTPSFNLDPGYRGAAAERVGGSTTALTKSMFSNGTPLGLHGQPLGETTRPSACGADPLARL